MLHRVDNIDKNKLFSNENMKVSPEFLERFIIELKNKGYSFISLDEVYEILQKQKKVRKCIVFTLDDGYKDNYSHAYDIFKKYNIPFTIYITTSFPNNNAILWWYILEDLILENDKVVLQNNQIFITKTKKDKEKAFLRIRSIIMSLPRDNFIESLNDLFINYKIDWFSKSKELSMSWEEIIDISKNSLCTIGGHTENHLALNTLTKEEIIEEIIKSNELLSNKIGKPIEHFAYPFGSRNEVNQREFDIVKELKFKTVTTTRHGTIYKEHRKYLDCCLPRVMLTENFDINTIGRIRKQRIVSI
jgi:peptidoglycan/xylan/chitin deacetylase (PgdA/CDA1 family)